jgi:hypothetical protein
LVTIGAGIVARRFWTQHNMTERSLALLVGFLMGCQVVARFVIDDVMPVVKAHWSNAPAYAAIVYVGSKNAAKAINHAAQCTAGLTEAIALAVADSAAVTVAKCMVKAHINAQMGRKVFAHV